MPRTIKSLFLSVSLCSLGADVFAESGDGSPKALELSQPRLSLRLQGEMGRRIILERFDHGLGHFCIADGVTDRNADLPFVSLADWDNLVPL